MSENRKQHWESIYSEKSPLEVSWYQQQPSISLDMIKRSASDRMASIIDVGGGASTLVDHLCNQGYEHITVLDISGHALQYARQRLADKANSIRWIEHDITEFRSDAHFDIWHDRAVFHFLTAADDRKKYTQALKHSLKPGGHAIIAAFAIGGPTRCSGLDIVQYDADKLGDELGETFSLLESCSEMHTTPGKAKQAFNYYRYHYTEATA